jgi:IPT/TIG domain
MGRPRSSTCSGRPRPSRRILPAALGGILLALCGCGGNSAPPYNQTPAITQIVPSNITAGSQTFTVFISGTGFISTNKGVTFAYWNGSARSTNYNLTTGQLEMTVLASDVANPGTAQVTVVNPAPGGGEAQTASTFTIEPPQASGPVIASIAPASAAVNSKPPLVTINGSNFSVTDVVAYNGQDRASTSTYLSQDEMQIQLATTDVSTASIGSISVGDPGLVLASPSVSFAVNGPNAASPSVGSLDPSSAAAGSADTQVLVKGSGFVTNSTVLWNSVPVATAYVSSSAVVAMIPAADLATAGTADVSVMNPPPGGGTSSTTTFAVSAP